MSRSHNTSTTLGKLLRIKHLRVRDLADMSGIHERTLSNYLAGRVGFVGGHAQKIADALDVPVAWLTLPPEKFSRTNQPSP